MNDEWNTLFLEAKKRLISKEISSFITSGTYSCAIKTKRGNIYTGINVLTTSKLSNTAEVNAILNMINNNETTITKIIVLNELDEIIIPCEEAIKSLLELDINPDEIEILTENKNVIKLSEILPDWWGTLRI